MNPADSKLAGITLFEAFWNRDREGIDAMVNSCEPIELVSGLVGVVAHMAALVAHLEGVEVLDVIGSERVVFLEEQATT